MKIFNRIRGPRLSTKLLMWGLLLLVVPYISYRQLVGMERLLIQGQSQAQLLTAESVSTLFNGREDLFNDLPVRIEDYESLYARPLAAPIRIDGRLTDWGDVASRFLSFGVEGDRSLGEGGFELLLGERGGQLHAFMRVRDSSIVYRDPASLRLNNTDHIRLSFIRADGEDGRIGIFFPGAGVTTAYNMDADWRYAATGAPINHVQGYALPVDGGLNVEFRMPLEMLGSHRFFGISYVDVDDRHARVIRGITQTLPQADKTSFNLVVLRSPEVLNIIQGLGYSGARILVIDAQNRVRAETGSFNRPGSDSEARWTAATREWFQYVRPLIHRLVMWQRWEDEYSSVRDQSGADAVIRASLQGEPFAVRRSMADGQEIIMAAHPIVSGQTVIGTVVVEQNIDEILAFQRSALDQAIVLSIVSLLVVLLSLLAFAGRLAWRIRHLRREASGAIDQYGRLRTNTLQSEVYAGDEIGDLARSVSAMLSKLHQHTQFLENMPRTLRHEINNPLNALSTSLQNLAQENPEIENSKYLESAKRGVMRIGAIVQNLADAASLEESLEAEELEIVDIQQLLENYVANCRVVHPHCTFIYKGTTKPVYVRVSDYRIEQMLDKIIDNALDFHRANSPIRVQLDVVRDQFRITVANRGPTLPPAAANSLFDSMVSHRGADSQNRLHFGLGLYVVRIIAQYHGGSARAANLADGSGVAIMVQLPLAEIEQQASAPLPLPAEIRTLPN
jgi:two-component system, OmpR family, sensor histidine kinase ChvG